MANQYLLFEEGLEEGPMDDDIKQNVYYLALSGFQKAVRRGMPEIAVNLARVCHSLEPYRLFGRMHTVLLEEAGLNEPLLMALFKWRGSYKEFSEIRPLIQLGASSTHFREIYPVVHNLRKMVRYTPEVMEYFSNAGYELLFKIVDKWTDGEFKVYEALGIPEDKMWIVELCERLGKYDREGVSEGIPFFFMKPNFMEELFQPDEVDGVDDGNELLNGFLPICAADGHTRIGLRLLNAVYDSTKYRGPLERKHMKLLFFFNEGFKLKRRLPPKVDFYPQHARQMANGVYFDPIVQKIFADTLKPRMDEIRKWSLLTGEYKPVMEKLTEMYNKNKIIISE